MKIFIDGLLSAFSMYSAVPVKSPVWNDESMKYTMCFFPFVGAFTALICFIWYLLCVKLRIHVALCAAGMTVIPVLINGGIHLDGFVDTADALGSKKSGDELHRIMKDPHIGASGLIMCCVYMVAYFGLWVQVSYTPEFIFICFAGFVMSRSLSGFSIVYLNPAKSSGLAYIFNKNADRRPAGYAMIFYMLTGSALSIFFCGWWGVVFSVLCIIWFIRYRKLCYRRFGGVTGDLAGYFMQLTELLAVFTAAFAGVIS